MNRSRRTIHISYEPDSFREEKSIRCLVETEGRCMLLDVKNWWKVLNTKRYQQQQIDLTRTLFKKVRKILKNTAQGQF